MRRRIDGKGAVGSRADGTPPARPMAHRFALGFSSAGIGQLISASQAFLLVPLFLRAWGQNVYGHWLSLTALIAYLSLLDLGGQSYVGNLLTIDFARADMEKFRLEMQQSVATFIGIALAALLALTVFLFVVSPFLWSTNAGPFATPDSRWIVLFAGSSLLITIPGGVYVTVYRATGLFVRGQMIGNGIRLTELGCYVGLLCLAVPPVAYGVALMVAAVARTAIVTRDIHKHTPAPALRLSPRLAWTGKKYLRGSLQFWLMSLAQALNQQGVILVVAAVSGAGAVAAFATHRTAAGLVGYVSTLTLAPLWPELSRLWATERLVHLRQVTLLSIRAVVLVSGMTALLLWFILPLVYPLWTGRRLHLQPVLLGILLVQALLAGGWSTSAWTMLAANRQQKLAQWSLANAIVTITLALWLGHRSGVTGVATASLIGDVLCGLAVYPVLAGHFLHIPVVRLYGVMTRTCIWLLPLGAALYGTTRLASGATEIGVSLVATLAWGIPAARYALGEVGRQQIQTVFSTRRRALEV